MRFEAYKYNTNLGGKREDGQGTKSHIQRGQVLRRTARDTISHTEKAGGDPEHEISDTEKQGSPIFLKILG